MQRLMILLIAILILIGGYLFLDPFSETDQPLTSPTAVIPAPSSQTTDRSTTEDGTEASTEALPAQSDTADTSSATSGQVVTIPEATLEANDITPEERAEAIAHITTLAPQQSDEPIDVREANHFVRGTQMLTLPPRRSDTAASEVLEADATPAESYAVELPASIQAQDTQPASQNTATRQGTVTQPTPQPTQPNQLIVEQPIPAGSESRTGTLVVPDTSATAASNGQLTSVVNEMLNLAPDAGRINPGGSGSLSIAATSLSTGGQIRLQELFPDPDQAATSYYYIHSVTDADRFGIWGILRQGLIETFAEGIQISEVSQFLSAQIPEDADRLQEDMSSSFLGLFLHQKVQESVVYNFHQGLIGQNPHLIKPGQELVIINFKEEELVGVYNHFARSQ